MAVSDVVRSVAVLGYALAPASSPTALLVCFAVLEGFGVALFQPAWRAVLPQVVPADRLREVNAVVQLTNRLGLLLGAALGGVLVATVGPRPALLLDAATYMLSLTTLLVIRLPAVVEQAPEGLRAALHEAREGIAVVVRRPWVSVVMLQGTVQVLFAFAPMKVLLPVVAQERYGDGAYGILMACLPAGMILGSLVAMRLHPRREGLVAMHAVAPTAAVMALPGRRRAARRLRGRPGRRMGRHLDLRGALVLVVATGVPVRHPGPGVLGRAARHLRPGPDRARPRSRGGGRGRRTDRRLDRSHRPARHHVRRVPRPRRHPLPRPGSRSRRRPDHYPRDRRVPGPFPAGPPREVTTRCGDRVQMGTVAPCPATTHDCPAVPSTRSGTATRWRSSPRPGPRCAPTRRPGARSSTASRRRPSRTAVAARCSRRGRTGWPTAGGPGTARSSSSR